MELSDLITRCENELYLGFTNVESSGLNWLNVRLHTIFKTNQYLLKMKNICFDEESLR